MLPLPNNFVQVEKKFSAQNDKSFEREQLIVEDEIDLKKRQLSRVHRGRDNILASIAALRQTLDDSPRRFANIERKKMQIEEEWQRSVHKLSTVENVVQLQHVQREVRAEIRWRSTTSQSQFFTIFVPQ